MASDKSEIKTQADTADSRQSHYQDRTLSDRAYERILSMIVDGKFAVGSKLPTENELSSELEISRPVLRQALKQLRDDDVVVSRQGSGSYVKRRPDGSALSFAPVGSIADIQRTFEFRVAVEGEAAWLAATRRTEAHIARMKTALDELDGCVREGLLGLEADEVFHETICQAAENKYFLAARDSMKANILTGINLMRNLSLIKPRERMELVQKEHYAIFDAIVSQDEDAARLAMRQHVEGARKRFFEG